MTVVLPAEYAVDPLGVGRAIGLVEMGEIKAQLADEAKKDRERDQEKTSPSSFHRQPGVMARMLAQLAIGTASAQTAEAGRSDEVSVTLKPGEAIEVKLVMKKGAKVTFSWVAAGGVVNYDLHGEGAGDEFTSYKKGRGAAGADGVLQAAFAGNHGWYWRNRGRGTVTVTLRTNGDYADIKKML